jgi:hypothetical protein
LGTVRVGGVCFRLHPNDHHPRHAHAEYAETIVIVELRSDGTVDIADRADCVQPANAKRSDVKKILATAREHVELLVWEWERMH